MAKSLVSYLFTLFLRNCEKKGEKSCHSEKYTFHADIFFFYKFYNSWVPFSFSFQVNVFLVFNCYPTRTRFMYQTVDENERKRCGEVLSFKFSGKYVSRLRGVKSLCTVGQLTKKIRQHVSHR